MRKRFAAIILAAGYSSRMKALKATLPFGDKTVISRQVECFFNADISDVFVVVGYQAKRIKDVLHNFPVCFVANENFHQGMFSSVQAGVKAIDSSVYKGVFLSPVDYPLLQPYTLRELIENFDASQSKIIYPCYQGKKGHPPLFSVDLFTDILQAQVSCGLKMIFENYQSQARYIDMGNPTCIMDMDTKEEYIRAMQYYKQRTAPDRMECDYIYRRYNVPDTVIAHCNAVALTAKTIVEALHQKNKKIHKEIVYAAGLLHDVSKGLPNHALKGAMILKNMGYPRVASCIENHMDIPPSLAENISEESILYLADKIVDQERIVSFQERASRITADMPYANKAIQRLETAKRIKEKIEQVTGTELYNLINVKGTVQEQP